QVVHGEPQLVPVGAGAALPPVGHPAADARVADEHVEAAGGVLHVKGQLADLGQVGQVGADGMWVIHNVRGDYLGRGRLELASVAAVQDQGRPVGREPAGQGAAETVSGAGEEDGGYFGHGRFLGRGCGPASAVTSSSASPLPSGSRLASTRYQMTPNTMSATVPGDTPGGRSPRACARPVMTPSASRRRCRNPSRNRCQNSGSICAWAISARRMSMRLDWLPRAKLASRNARRS